tara:strand:+ start:5951 stop:7168 length:1218 start_codon:yes stop_codon:yes gene_type:complete
MHYQTMFEQRRQQATLSSQDSRLPLIAGYDFWLVCSLFLIILIGSVMVASATISHADKYFSDPLYYFWNQGQSIILGLFLVVLFLKIPILHLQTLSRVLLIVAITLLTLTLIPGIGKEVNGSMRWIQLGPKSFQAAELVKFFFITYLAGYLVHHRESVRSDLIGFLKPVFIVAIISILLLKQPDYGSCAVLCATAIGMLFLAGAPLGRFFIWLPAFVGALGCLIILSPYRMQRLMSFRNPEQDPFDTGYQLLQALTAFGRGDWVGVGLGSGVQKLFYLPEQHTDFIFSVIAEELGLIGTVSIILLFFFIVWRAFMIGRVAESIEKYFSAYLAYGIGLIIGLQAYINIGVNMGVLPTKGLTLPFISYGGNSMIVYCISFGVLLRVEYENRQNIRTVNKGSVSAYAT